MNALIGFSIFALVVLVVAVFVTVRYGPPKDARRKQVKLAQSEARRTRIVLNDVKKILLAESESSLDLVGLDLRRRSLNVITDYENKELERNSE